MSALNHARRHAEHDRTSLQTLDGDVQVLVTFDYSRAERETRIDPACAASVFVTGVAINGHEVDAGVFHPKVIASWQAEILREVLEDESESRAMAAEALGGVYATQAEAA